MKVQEPYFNEISGRRSGSRTPRCRDETRAGNRGRHATNQARFGGTRREEPAIRSRGSFTGLSPGERRLRSEGPVAVDQPFEKHERRESNPQPPVLETGALPIELRSYLSRPARGQEIQRGRSIANPNLERPGLTRNWNPLVPIRLYQNRTPGPAKLASRRSGHGPRAASKTDHTSILLLSRLLVRSVLPFSPAIFLEFEAIGPASFFLHPVVALAATGAFQPNIFTHRPILIYLAQTRPGGVRMGLAASVLLIEDPSSRWAGWLFGLGRERRFLKKQTNPSPSRRAPEQRNGAKRPARPGGFG